MRLLLDTHAFIWWDEAPSRLGASAYAACLDPANELAVSAVSAWEMQIKRALGKLTIRKPLRQLIGDQVEHNALEVLPVSLEHVLRLDALPSIHKDPFDRLLVAQALAENCALISHDPIVAQYPVTVIW